MAVARGSIPPRGRLPLAQCGAAAGEELEVAPGFLGAAEQALRKAEVIGGGLLLVVLGLQGRAFRAIARAPGGKLIVVGGPEPLFPLGKGVDLPLFGGIQIDVQRAARIDLRAGSPAAARCCPMMRAASCRFCTAAS